MPYLSDAALDAALNHIKTNGTQLHICSAEPANFAGIAAVELADAAVTLTGPINGDVSGRKVTIPAVSSDGVETSGTATHWALSDNASVLVATGSITPNVALSDTGTYSFTATDIEIPDAVSE